MLRAKPLKSRVRTMPRQSTVAKKSPKAFRSVAARLDLGHFVVDVKRVSVADARSEMPRLVRAAGSGDVFEIYNAKNLDAPTAVLVGPEVLRQHGVAASRKRRTLRELVDSLPFKRHEAPRLRAALPDDDAPALRLRAVAKAAV